VHDSTDYRRRLVGRPEAVLLDRDGTLVVDVPYNGDPARVVLMPGAARALARLRDAGIPVAMISNQSGVGRGLLTMDQVEAVNRRVEELVGPVGPWMICPHGPDDGCACRKPAPGLVLGAAAALGVDPTACVIVGDIGADVEAARAAGARAILVPTPVTRPEEVAAASELAPTLEAAVDMLLDPRPHVLVVRLDSAGDVLLSGPAVRAVAAGARKVTYLCGPRGRAAAGLLPGIDDIVVHHAPWIDPEPEPVSRPAVDTLVDDLAGRHIDVAVILTSWHQSALPTALLLRMAGVPIVAAISDDYPGSLLDVRHRVDDGVHEVTRALSTVATLGFHLPHGDDGRLRLKPLPEPPDLEQPYTVVHPGASVPARAWHSQASAALVDALVAAGRRVVVTGSPDEADLAAFVAGPSRPQVVDLGGRTDLAGLAAVLAGADCVVVGNTGPAHLAAAVGTPIVSLFAPTVPLSRWAPWGVPTVVLGDQDIECGGCRAKVCPVAGHPCLSEVPVDAVVDAVEVLAPTRAVGAPA
jgi:histidinol-phosphate phosphatase family protein